MKLERDKFYAIYLMSDDEGYITEVVVRDDGERPEGNSMRLTCFLNEPMKQLGETFYFERESLSPVTK
jgi:hypothetical protein